MKTRMIVGLGNPGPQYALTKHNIGFLALDLFAAGFGEKNWQSESKAWILKIRNQDLNLYLVKPQTFMNLSGEAVRALTNFYKIEKEDILVVHDELDLPFGSLRFHKNRGHGGHNGIRSIHEQLGTPDYPRLKLGIGRPPQPGPDVAAWVLSKFGGDEESQLTEFLNRAGDAFETWLDSGFDFASNKYNGK